MHLMEMKSNLQGDLARPPSLPQLGSSPPQTWLHSPPTQMPWGTKQPPLVRFTGGLYGGGLMSNPNMPFNPDNCQPYNFPLTQPTPIPGLTLVHSVGIKRKFDEDEAEMLSAVNKLHISETKLASHRAGLHALNQEVEDEACGPRLVLSDELKQLTAQDAILPKPLMDRMRNKNSMALVLWQPPKPRMMPMPEPEEDGNNNNNSSESLDLNTMPTFNEEPRLSNFTDQQDDDVEMEML